MAEQSDRDDVMIAAMALVVFVGKADGVYVRAELREVDRIFREYMRRFRSDEYDDELRENVFQRLREGLHRSNLPEEHVANFIETIANAANAQEIATFLIEAIERVAAADGVAELDEAMWEGRIIRKLREIR